MASVAKLKDLVDALVSGCGESGEGSLGRCIGDLEKFFGEVDGSELLKRALESPVVPVGEKAAALDDMCRLRGFSGAVRNFLVMAAEFGKWRALSTRRRAVLDRLKSVEGAVKATVTSARPLSGPDAERIRSAVARLSGGAKTEVEFIEDSEIIGGIVVRVGNSVYDDSVKTHLDRMRLTLSR